MTKVKKIKIFTHNRGFISAILTPEKNNPQKSEILTGVVFKIIYYTGLAVIGSFNFFKNLIFKTCFHTGNIIIKSLFRIFTVAKNDIIETVQNIPKRFKLIFSKQFTTSFVTFFIIVSAGVLALQSLNLVAYGLEIKNKLLKTALVGNYYLSNAKKSLLEQDTTGAENAFAKAYQTFSQGQEQLNNANQSFALLLNFLPQKQDADRMIKAAGLVSQAGSQFIALQKDLNQISLSAGGLSAGDRPTEELLRNIDDGLSQASDKVVTAQKLVTDINEKSIPQGSRENFEQLKSQLNILAFALTNFNEVFSLTKSLALGEKNVLVLFENNNEIRASGGFIGTYGNLKMVDGKILSIKVSSIYDLDGQLAESIKPPSPILNVNPKWYMRDSNWFAHFPQTAKTISGFYEKEGGETPDLVVAMTPDLIIDWLKITGPVLLPHYNLTLTADNFVEQTQVATTLNENSPVSAPKQILADLVPLLLQKLSEEDKSALPQIIQALQDNLSKKQIVLYAKSPELQNKIATFHWDGGILDTERDYLSIVSSNLGGTKTDLYIDQTNELHTTIADDGTITNELTITRTNKLPELEGTTNTSFIRIFTPKGSKMMSVLGFDYKNLDFPEDINYKIDSNVFSWEKNSLRDVLSGTIIGQEANKTFFGNWLSVKGGESRTIKITYQLPFKLDSIDNYSLLAQKQIGQVPQDFKWSLNFSGRSVAWKNFDPAMMETSSLNSDIILNKDIFLGLILTKR
ncbi:MAG: DUF4012 domain-containing protein [Candidatus Doudnabacteria bacterium]|jgi:hypothetical protein